MRKKREATEVTVEDTRGPMATSHQRCVAIHLTHQQRDPEGQLTPMTMTPLSLCGASYKGERMGDCVVPWDNPLLCKACVAEWKARQAKRWKHPELPFIASAQPVMDLVGLP